MPEPCFHSRSTLKNRIGIKTRPQMLNESHNAETSGAISTDASQATVRVIRTDEELMIARSVCRALGPGMAGEKGIPTLRRNTVLGWIRFRRAVAPIIHGRVIPHSEAAPPPAPHTIFSIL